MGTSKNHSRAQSTSTESASKEQRKAAATRPTLATPAGVMQLQRTAGNAATHRLIQAKLNVGAAHDPLEQEADRVADQVVSRASIQRNPEEDELMTKRVDISRAPQEEDELLTKRGSMLDSFDAGSDFESKLGSSGSGSPLDGKIRSQMERGIGADFSNVRVHTGDHASSLNRSISARAFTRGSDVFFDKGQYNPGSIAGQRLLAHELTHVVQQGGASQAPVQRWPWSKKNKAVANTPNSDTSTALSVGNGESVDETPADITTANSGDTPSLSINPDYSNNAVKDQPPTRFRYSVLVWQQNKNYLMFQKVRAWSMFRNRLRSAARATGIGKLFTRKAKTSQEVKQKAARTVATQETGFSNLDQQQQLQAINRAMSQSNELGHTWSRLTAYADDEVKDIYSFGFWPSKGISRPDQPTEGDVMHPDNVHDSDAPLRVMHYDIPAQNYQTALKWADSQVQSPPQYKMIGLNCTSWSRMLAGKAGASFPSSANVFPAEPTQGFFQRIHSPNRLYEDLENTKGSEDTIDAIPKKPNPYSITFDYSSFGRQGSDESSSEDYEMPERGSEHRLIGPLDVKTVRRITKTIPAGTNIMVTEANDEDEIRVESERVSNDYDGFIRGFTDLKSFHKATTEQSAVATSSTDLSGSGNQNIAPSSVPRTPQLSDFFNNELLSTMKASNDDLQHLVDMGLIDASVLQNLPESLLQELADNIDLSIEELRTQISELND